MQLTIRPSASLGGMVPTLLAVEMVQVPVSGCDRMVTPKAAPSATLTGNLNGTCAPGVVADGVGETTSLPFEISSPVDFRPLTTPPRVQVLVVQVTTVCCTV